MENTHLKGQRHTPGLRHPRARKLPKPCCMNDVHGINALRLCLHLDRGRPLSQPLETLQRTRQSEDCTKGPAGFDSIDSFVPKEEPCNSALDWLPSIPRTFFSCTAPLFSCMPGVFAHKTK